jgi:hypothetical protein
MPTPTLTGAQRRVLEAIAERGPLRLMRDAWWWMETRVAGRLTVQRLALSGLVLPVQRRGSDAVDLYLTDAGAELVARWMPDRAAWHGDAVYGARDG